MNRIYRMGFHGIRVCLVFILSTLLILSKKSLPPSATSRSSEEFVEVVMRADPDPFNRVAVPFAHRPEVEAHPH